MSRASQVAPEGAGPITGQIKVAVNPRTSMVNPDKQRRSQLGMADHSHGGHSGQNSPPRSFKKENDGSPQYNSPQSRDGRNRHGNGGSNSHHKRDKGGGSSQHQKHGHGKKHHKSSNMNADADEEVDEREHGADSPARPSSNAKKGPSGRQNGNSHDQHETKNPDDEMDDEIARKRARRKRIQQSSKKKRSKKEEKVQRRPLTERIMNAFGYTAQKVYLQDPKAVEAVNALRLGPKLLRKLRAKFDRIDIDASGNIDADEFFDAIQEPRSPFTDKLFDLIDLDHSGTIEFDEYVRVLATYCMFTKEDILRFCFDCFDLDGSGAIDENEFMDLCRNVNNAAPAFPSNFKKALTEFDVNDDGLIDYGEFKEIDRKFPLVLFPAFRLQDVMQRNTLGSGEWLRIIERFTKNKAVEEYKATHNGRSPPVSNQRKLAKLLLPCFYYDEVFVPVRVHHASGGEIRKKETA